MTQKQAAPPSSVPRSPGPLLTGRVAVDAALGFLGEIVAATLLTYSVWQFLRFLVGATAGLNQFLFIVGMFVTALFLFWHTKQMQSRYPTFGKGWQKGRDTWGKGVDHLVTLLYGVLVLCVLFPLGGLLIFMGMGIGPVAWIGALLIAYLFGILARRMSNGSKKSGGNNP